MKPYAWWRATALMALAAASLPFVVRHIAGPRGAIIHVRWQRSIDDTARRSLETRFALANRSPLSDDTWRYELIDPSADNIRTIVTHPAVDDTHDIDRRNYSVAPSAVRTARRTGFMGIGDVAVRTVDVGSIILGAFTAILIGLVRPGRPGTPVAPPLALSTTTVRLSRGLGVAWRRIAGWLSRGIPAVQPNTAGAFRIVFGVATIVFFATHPEGTASLDATFNPLVQDTLHAWILDQLRSHPSLVTYLMPWLLTMGVAFTVGIFTRLTYALFVGGALVWTCLAVVHDSTHPHSTLALTLVALLPSRWGDAFSLDRVVRRRVQQDGDGGRTKRYGYSVWVPGLVFGVAFAAAAWAKLAGSGPAWILNGTVKYHFITDSFNAPVTWGLQFAGHPRLAVLASFGTIAVEALVITAAFVRNEKYRLGLGAGALGLLAGFWLFMGVFWAGWWILLLGFLPWERLGWGNRGNLVPVPAISRVESVSVRSDIAAPAQVMMILAIIGQQVIISAMRVERAPMFTHYPMYSSTFASPAQYNSSIAPYYRIVISTDQGRMELSCNAPDDLVDELRAALDGSPESAARVWRAVGGCGADLEHARDVTFEGDIRRFDWERLTFTSTRAAVILGPLARSSG